MSAPRNEREAHSGLVQQHGGARIDTRALFGRPGSYPPPAAPGGDNEWQWRVSDWAVPAIGVVAFFVIVFGG